MRHLNEGAQVVALVVFAALILLACVVMFPFLRLQEWIGGRR